jgi:phosphohistidine phosphatase
VTKNLIVIRHAKSSWKNPKFSDEERPLNKRGRRDGARMAKFLAGAVPKPDWLLVSDAVRTRATANFLIEGLHLDEDRVLYEHRLYLAGVNRIYELIRECPDAQTLALVGHNPGVTDLVNSLGDNVITSNVPTFGVATFEVPINAWHELRPGMAKLTGYHTPKTL